jgi:hypothetical protein
MTITLRPEQEKVLLDAINSRLAHTTDEALDRALDTLRLRLAGRTTAETEAAAAVRRLATFGRRHGLSLGGSTVKELLRESRP